MFNWSPKFVHALRHWGILVAESFLEHFELDIENILSTHRADYNIL